MGKLLFIDVGVPASQQIVAATAVDVSAIVYDPATDTRATLLEKIAATGLQTISEVGFIQHGGDTMQSYVFLRDMGEGLVEHIQAVDSSMNSWTELISFYRYLHNTYAIGTIDLISCCLWNDPDWIYILKELESATSINFRASKNTTGSMVAGGDWYMESDGVDIRSVYFTEAVDSIEGLLLQNLPPQIVRLSYPTEIGYNRDRKRLRMSISNSTIPFTCQWSKNGFDISGATSTTLTISTTRFSDQGLYTFRATNQFGTSNSTIVLNVYENHGMTHRDNTDKYMVTAETIEYGRQVFDISADTHTWNWIPGSPSTSTSTTLRYTNIRWLSSLGTYTSISDILTHTVVDGENVYLVKESSTYTTGVYDSTLSGYTFKGVAISVGSVYKNIAILKSNGNVDFADIRSGYTHYFASNIESNVYAMISNGGAICMLKNDNSVTINSYTTDPYHWYGADESISAQSTPFVAVVPANFGGTGGFVLLDASGGLRYLGTTSTGYNAYIETLKNIVIVDYVGDEQFVAVDSAGKLYTWYYDHYNIPNTSINGNTSASLNVFAISNIKGTIISYDGKTAPISSTSLTTRSKPAVAIAMNSQETLNNDGSVESYTTTDNIKLSKLRIHNFEVSASRYLLINRFDGSIIQYPAFETPLITGNFRSIYNVFDYGSFTNSTSLISYTIPAPTIISQTPSSLVNIGGSTIIGVDISGIGPFKYQWTRNGVDISGSNNSYYEITNITESDLGTYNLLITTDNGSITSSNIVLTNSAPSIITQPLSLIVAIDGSSATISVDVIGLAPFAYQWMKNGQDISGATGSTYTINPVSADSSGNYTVRVSNSSGSTTSEPALLTVVYRPTIRTGPASINVIDGSSATFSVDVSGTAPFTYQWAKDGIDISGATGSTYTINTVSAGSSGNYSVRVSNDYGFTTSEPALLTVVYRPTIRTHPTPLFVIDGSSATFSVDVSGTAPFTYQWAKGGVDISGATGSSYTINTVSADSSGNYSVRVSNSYGSVSSNSALLTVVYRPTIRTHPTSINVIDGSSATFSVDVSGTAPFTYQWAKGGIDISGATGASYTINTVSASSGGNYSVRVSNSYGAVSSDPALLTVVYRPTIRTQPTPLFVIDGSSATFSVDVSGTAPFTYQWAKGGIDISGATSSSYIINTVSASSGGSYSVRVSNSYGSVSSNSALLTVVYRPTIRTGPVPLFVIDGSSATFSVDVSGTAPFTYQWRKNGSTISGATGASYTINTVSADSSGNYSVQVSNSYGSILSEEALLTVVYRPTIRTHPTSMNVIDGSSATFSVDVSGTAPFTYQWRKYGAEISGATGSSYTISAVSASSGGNYSVRVSNDYGVVISNSALLNIVYRPTIRTHPRSINVIDGSSATFSVDVSGTAPFTYQWRKNGSNISGATGTSYIINAVSADSSGNYSVQVSNSYGSIISDEAQLSIIFPPQIIQISPDTYQSLGSNIILYVDVSGTPPFTYQWEYDTTPIENSNTSIYSFILTAAARGFYRVKITSVLTNRFIYSDYISVSTSGAPIIYRQPVGSNVEPATAYTLSVSALSATTPSYQWKKTVADVETDVGQNQNTLAFSSFNKNDAGTYRVVITNADGSISSTSVKLNYGTPPTITAQPTGRTATVASSTTFSVQVSGSTPFTYQWKRGTTNIPGATSATYTAYPIIPEDDALYSVDISNISDVLVSSTPVRLSVVGSLTTSLIASGTLPINREVKFIENNVAHTGIKQTFTSSTPTVFIPSDTNFPRISVSSTATDISSVSMAITRTQQTADGTPIVFMTMSVFNNQNNQISDVANTPFSITLTNMEDIISPTIDIYRVEGADRVLAGTANRNPNGSYTLVLTHFSQYEILPSSVPCFVEGTRIATARGFVAVEDLEHGDRILTDDGRAVPFALARRVIEYTTTATAPYLVPADAFGPNMPPAPCRLSPTHAFQMAPGLWHFPELAARTNPAIRQYDVGRSCTYYHIKLPDYFTDNIVLEGGTVAESFGEDLKDLGFFFYYSEKHGGFVRIDPRTKKVRSVISHA